MNTAIFFADGFEEIEGLTVVDMFRRAGIPIQTVSISDSLTVTGSHDIKVQADCLLADFDFNTVEMLILPGGMPGTTNLSKCEPLCDALMQFSRQGRYLAAICAAPSILGSLGILNGRVATCYPGFEKKLFGAYITTDPVAKDGHVITSRGMGTAIEFASTLIGIIQILSPRIRSKHLFFIPLTLLKFFNLFLNLVDIPAFRISCKEYILEGEE